MRWWPKEDEYVISIYIYIHVVYSYSLIVHKSTCIGLTIYHSSTHLKRIHSTILISCSPMFFGYLSKAVIFVEVWLSSVPRQQPDLSTFQRLCWNPHGGWLFRLGRRLRAGKHRAILRWSVNRRFRPSHGGTHCRSFGFGVGGGAQEWMQFFKGQI